MRTAEQTCSDHLNEAAEAASRLGLLNDSDENMDTSFSPLRVRGLPVSPGVSVSPGASPLIPPRSKEESSWEGEVARACQLADSLRHSDAFDALYELLRARPHNATLWIRTSGVLQQLNRNREAALYATIALQMTASSRTDSTSIGAKDTGKGGGGGRHPSEVSPAMQGLQGLQAAAHLCAARALLALGRVLEAQDHLSKVSHPPPGSVTDTLTSAMQALDSMAAARGAMDSVSNIEHLFGRARAFLDLCPPIPGLVSPPKARVEGGEASAEAEELRRNAREFAQA